MKYIFLIFFTSLAFLSFSQEFVQGDNLTKDNEPIRVFTQTDFEVIRIVETPCGVADTIWLQNGFKFAVLGACDTASTPEFVWTCNSLDSCEISLFSDIDTTGFGNFVTNIVNTTNIFQNDTAGLHNYVANVVTVTSVDWDCDELDDCDLAIFSSTSKVDTTGLQNYIISLIPTYNLNLFGGDIDTSGLKLLIENCIDDIDQFVWNCDSLDQCDLSFFGTDSKLDSTGLQNFILSLIPTYNLNLLNVNSDIDTAGLKLLITDCIPEIDNFVWDCDSLDQCDLSFFGVNTKLDSSGLQNFILSLIPNYNLTLLDINSDIDTSGLKLLIRDCIGDSDWDCSALDSCDMNIFGTVIDSLGFCAAVQECVNLPIKFDCYYSYVHSTNNLYYSQFNSPVSELTDDFALTMSPANATSIYSVTLGLNVPSSGTEITRVEILSGKDFNGSVVGTSYTDVEIFGNNYLNYDFYFDKLDLPSGDYTIKVTNPNLQIRGVANNDANYGSIDASNTISNDEGLLALVFNTTNIDVKKEWSLTTYENGDSTLTNVVTGQTQTLPNSFELNGYFPCIEKKDPTCLKIGDNLVRTETVILPVAPFFRVDTLENYYEACDTFRVGNGLSYDSALDYEVGLGGEQEKNTGILAKGFSFVWNQLSNNYLALTNNLNNNFSRFEAGEWSWAFWGKEDAESNYAVVGVEGSKATLYATNRGVTPQSESGIFAEPDYLELTADGNLHINSNNDTSCVQVDTSMIPIFLPTHILGFSDDTNFNKQRNSKEKTLIRYPVSALGGESGSYTPTVTHTSAGITNSVVQGANYSRNGDIVHVTGNIIMTGASGLFSSMSISLPIPSNFTNAFADVNGTSNVYIEGAPISEVASRPAADVANNSILISHNSITNGTVNFSILYIVK